jgi:hypothetical protein
VRGRMREESLRFFDELCVLLARCELHFVCARQSLGEEKANVD